MKYIEEKSGNNCDIEKQFQKSMNTIVNLQYLQLN